MKVKHLVFLLFVLVFSVVLSTIVAAEYVTATAVQSDTPIRIDAEKDDVYSYSTPITVKNGDNLVSQTYFAWDADYLYAYTEVIDSTNHIFKDYKGEIDDAIKGGDAFGLGVNFSNLEYAYIQWGGKNASPNFGGRYFALRDNSQPARQGMMLGLDVICTTKETDSGYSVEMAIPFSQVQGYKYDITKHEAVAVQCVVVDNTGSIAHAQGDDANVSPIYSSGNSKISYSAEVLPYRDGATYWDKLEFTGPRGGEITKIPESSTTAPATTVSPDAPKQEITSGTGYSTAIAAGAVNAPNIDGVKDKIYTYSTPLEIPDIGGASGKAYFAYDKSNIYVYAEINDSTPAFPDADSKFNITPASNTDTVMISVHMDNADGNTQQYNGKIGDGNGPSTSNDHLGIYGVFRGATEKLEALQGGYAFLNKGWYNYSTSNKNGYIVELRIPIGVDVDGTPFDTDKLFENGIAVLFSIHDSSTGADAYSANGTWYSSNTTVEHPRSKAYGYSESAPQSWDKLEFGEIVDVPASTTSAPTVTTTPAPTITTLPAVTTEPPTLPSITTTVPVFTQSSSVAAVTSSLTLGTQTADSVPGSFQLDGSAMIFAVATVAVVLAIAIVIVIILYKNKKK